MTEKYALSLQMSTNFYRSSSLGLLK